jgi:hypothetical protein
VVTVAQWCERDSGAGSEDEPNELWCSYCGRWWTREEGEIPDHYSVRTMRPVLLVSPRCQPVAVVAWTNVVLFDALAVALRLPEPHS